MNAEKQKYTKMFRDFLDEEAKLLSFISFTYDLAVGADYVQFVAEKALSGNSVEKNSDGISDFNFRQKIVPKEKRRAANKYRTYRQFIMQILVCRLVDSFLSYISDMLSQIFRKRHELLKSKDAIRADFILKHDSMSDLIASMAEKKVHELSYEGMDDLSKFIGDRLGIKLFESDDQKKLIMTFIEYRNIITHNRGVVNQVFLNKTKKDLPVGTALELESDWIWDTANQMRMIAKRFDKESSEKFSLDVVDEDIQVHDFSELSRENQRVDEGECENDDLQPA